MIRNKDFAMLYAGRAVFDKNGEFAGVAVGWNNRHGVILGVDHLGGWQAWDINDIGVTEEEFQSYEYHNAGMLVEPDEPMYGEEAPKHKTIGELIKEHEGMKPVSTGYGLENVSSKI